ncbi:SpoIIE family protein phosphatase [Streptomyces polyrhachis]|uniref:SpoIIE family protein phosphatase n=1 Tax=Streptomyces polyrhachis TaxID=1282885 RepID=A0ABW2GB50_9ACTN
MRIEETLSAVGTGVWRWDTVTGEVDLDPEAVSLLGLPPDRTTTTAAEVRSRYHPVDYMEIKGLIDLAVSEGTLAEAVLRVVDEEGRTLRTVRGRWRPLGDGRVLVGTVQELVEPSPSSSSRGSPLPGAAAGTSPPSPLTSDWRLSREAFLLDAGRALAEAGSTDEVLRVAASLAMPGFSPDGMAVFGTEGDQLTIVGHQGYRKQDETPFRDIPLDSDYPAAVAIRTGRAIYLPSPEEYARRFPEAWRLAGRLGRRSWAFLPLTAGGRTTGAWMASFSHGTAFTPDERSVLTTVARMLAAALSRAHVQESERELSAGLQRTMMPATTPEIPGLEVAARYVPTGGGLDIGGDWYDVISLTGDNTALVIGDVQGHDVRAAGLMSQLRIAVRAYAAEGHHPDAVLTRASRFLCGINQLDPDSAGGAGGAYEDRRFATCLYLEVDPRDGRLVFARAGHLDPAVGLRDGTMRVRPTEGGLPLGIVPDPDYPLTVLRLEYGETLLLCSDGLVETGGHDLDTGRDRIREIFAAHAGEELEAIADALLDAVSGVHAHEHPGPHSERREDDIALILLRRTGRAAGAGQAGRNMHLVVTQDEQQRVADARHELRAMLHDWSTADQVDSAELVLSELIANVLVHTEGDARVRADITGPPGERTLRVEVADSDDELPHRRHPGELASSGRGVLLLEALSNAWGVEPRGLGKSIWFEMYEGEEYG